jgi:hypothetical protein
VYGTHLDEAIALLALGHVDVEANQASQCSREACIVQQADCDSWVELVTVVTPLIKAIWATNQATWQLVVVGVCGPGQCKQYSKRSDAHL